MWEHGHFSFRRKRKILELKHKFDSNIYNIRFENESMAGMRDRKSDKLERSVEDSRMADG